MGLFVKQDEGIDFFQDDPSAVRLHKFSRSKIILAEGSFATLAKAKEEKYKKDLQQEELLRPNWICARCIKFPSLSYHRDSYEAIKEHLQIM